MRSMGIGGMGVGISRHVEGMIYTPRGNEVPIPVIRAH